MKSYIPPFDATVVKRMKESGFSFAGKTNMDEFGFGSFGINCEQPSRNPFNVDYVTGGSSSGAAVATAILKYHVAIAESTGGSISAPAAFCGVVGFTPTYGVVSRYGLIDYANSLDKIGIMARSSNDIKIVFDKIKGKDKMDTTSVGNEITNRKIKRITVINQTLDSLDKEVRIAFDRLLDKLSGQGYEIVKRDFDEIKFAVPVYDNTRYFCKSRKCKVKIL